MLRLTEAACRFDSDKTKNASNEALRIAAYGGAAFILSVARALSSLASGPLFQENYWRRRCHDGEGKSENG